MDEDIKIRKNNIWIILLYTLSIILLLVIITFVVFRMVVNAKKENNEEMHKLSTSRRTTTSSLTEPTTELTTEEIITSTTTTTTTTITSKMTTTVAIKTTVAPIIEEDEEEDVEPIVPEVPSVTPESIRTPTTSASTNPNALNDWEWKIVELINNERRNRGLNELVVASELRNIAETSIEQSVTIKELTNALTGYSNYHTIVPNVKNENKLYDYMVTDKIGSLVVSEPYLSYIGIGVIKKIGPDGLLAYYYVIIFE